MIEGEIAGRDKEIGANIGDPRPVIRAENAQVELLNEIIDIAQSREVIPKIGANSGFMRLNLLGKPARLV
jgi:hypothetical protein